MRAVTRHVFVPDVELSEAYANGIVVIKRGPDGRVLSCASAPAIVGFMLDQLDAQPGERILEIGSGTGYNAGHARRLVRCVLRRRER